MAVVPGDPANSVYVSIGLAANAPGRPGPVDGPGVTYAANYETVADWQTARMRDLISLDETEIVECYNDWPTGLLFATDINSGWTSGVGNRVIFRSALGNGPTNYPTDGFHFKSGLSDRAFRSYARATRVQRMGFVSNAGNSAYEAIVMTQRECQVLECFVQGAQGHAIRFANHEGVIRNNFVICAPGTTRDGIDVGHVCWVENNTVSGGRYGIVCSRSDFQARIRNNVCFGASAVDYSLNVNNTTAGNVDSDGSSPDGVYTITNPADEFVQSDGGDLHLLEGSGCRGKATDLSSDPDYPFDNDIDGDTRAAWDCGADEYQASGPPVTPSGNPVLHGTNF